jgi:hypothetical protein
LEYSVKVSPAGQVIAFERKLMENDSGPRLDADAARLLAEAFIANALKVDTSKWQPMESRSEDLSGRRDHTLEYELKGFREKDAVYRLKVEVQGAEVGSFRRYLKVPETWERTWDRQRNQNEVFQYVDEFLFFLLVVAVVFQLIRNIRAGQVSWRVAVWVGGVMAALLVLALINELPLTLSGYDTTQTYSAWFGMILLSLIIGCVVQGGLVTVQVGAGERLYRQDHPDRLFLPALFSRRGQKTREFIQATLMGYILAAFHIGFVVLYYIVGYKWGVWAPADVKYDNSVSTLAPWLIPLAVSVMAATNEEFMFRFFGIAFLRRLIKSLPLAVILQAFIWGFLHSSYPQQPGFVRGIEVGIIGVVAGFIMLRFGIWATLTWHFTIDAIFIGLFLFQSHNAYFWVSGLIVCGWISVPAVIALIHYLRHRGFEPANELLNRSVVAPPRWKEKLYAPVGVIPEPAPLPTMIPAEPPGYVPLSAKARRAALVLGSLGILLALVPGPRQFGDKFSLKIDRKEAINIARKTLTEKFGKNPDDYKVVAESNDINGGTNATLVRRHCDLTEAETILLSPDGAFSINWCMWFKREFDPEIYRVWVSQVTGDVKVYRDLADTTSGENLQADSAEELAATTFRTEEALPDNYHLVVSKADKKEHRTDYYFTWESTEPILSDSIYNDAFYRRGITVQGNTVIPGGRYIKVPEKWERHEQEHGLRFLLNIILFAALMIGAVVLALIAFGKRLKGRELNWRIGIPIGIAYAILTALAYWNQWATIWEKYETAKPVSGFITIELVGAVVSVLLAGLMAMIVAALADALIRQHYDSSPWLIPGKAGKRAAEDGAMTVLGILGVLVGLRWLLAGLTGWLNLPVHSYTLKLPEGITHYLPWFTFFAKAIGRALLGTTLLFVAFILLETAVRRGWLRWLILIALALAVGGIRQIIPGNPTTGEWLWSVIRVAVLISAAYLVLKHWVRERLWAAMTAWFLYTILTAGVTLLGWKYSTYPPQGWLLVGIGAVTIAYLLWRSLAKSEKVGK